MTRSRLLIVAWLGVVCATVWVMIIVGGVTRLTGSGLSMVDWRPIMGIIPPLNESEWQAAFDAYRQFPEYQQVNRGMSLEAFKGIFFWEYAHRVLGRMIGIIYFVPLVLLWALGHVEQRYRVRLVVALFLGGLQGLLGWYMVKSGLIDVPRVSHYRLAAHLSLAMFIMCYLFWLILDLADVPRQAVTPRTRRLVYAVTGAVVLQILYGAFTAGLRAGYGYNTWPLMNGEFMSTAVFFMEPLWINFFESGATVQFIHRWLAVVVLGLAVWLWLSARQESRQMAWAAALLLGAILVQFAIGVLTLVHVVPVSLGTLHQGWAVTVLLALVYMTYASGKVPVPSEQHENLPGANQYHPG